MAIINKYRNAWEAREKIDLLYIWGKGRCLVLCILFFRDDTDNLKVDRGI